MAFYDLTRDERKLKYINIENNISKAVKNKELREIKAQFDHHDTYFRKAAYLAVGKIYTSDSKVLQNILECLNKLYEHESERIIKTVIFSCREIAIYDFESVKVFFNKGMIDYHHTVRIAVVGSLKKWVWIAKKYFSYINKL